MRQIACVSDCYSPNMTHFIILPSLFFMHNSLPLGKKPGLALPSAKLSAHNETHRVNHLFWVLVTLITGRWTKSQEDGRSTSTPTKNSFKPDSCSWIHLKAGSQIPAHEDENVAPNSPHVFQTKFYEWKMDLLPSCSLLVQPTQFQINPPPSSSISSCGRK